MTPLLELRDVNRRYGRGMSRRTVLHEVSLTLDAGELVTIWGKRRSGRSTLLRIAAGVERADSGYVSFGPSGQPGTALGEGVGYCRNSFPAAIGTLVRDQLMIVQLARGTSTSQAAERARRSLERCRAEQYAALKPGELNGAERVRVSIARALTLQPRLIVIDEPTLYVDLLARDEILQLLRSLADEGIAVLASAGETTGLAGSDRALALSDGHLHGQPEPARAEVFELRPSVGRQAHA